VRAAVRYADANAASPASSELLRLSVELFGPSRVAIFVAVIVVVIVVLIMIVVMFVVVVLVVGAAIFLPGLELRAVLSAAG